MSAADQNGLGGWGWGCGAPLHPCLKQNVLCSLNECVNNFVREENTGGEDNCGLLIVSINRSLIEPSLCLFTQILLTLQYRFQT